ncbi:MAG: peptidoglycan-binding protein [Rhodobacteraceae bacterium]|jgi:peptidoglycan hydrolase-like protein with peptidoglycan-binding domain|nr:peptidoglycan-binding protein [Paracoccaceae bacterium]SFD29820.1 Putative peptidoglycan binding domain-containing protein [Salipiger profundus]
MLKSFLMASATALVITGHAFAQSNTQELVYIQIEAQPSLNQAEQSLRGYARQLDNVNGFSLGGGWYGIALGPYQPDSAQALLRSLRGNGLIPRDSYLAASTEYNDQFWPVGAALNDPQAAPGPEAEEPEEGISTEELAQALDNAPDTSGPQDAPAPEAEPEPQPEPVVDETPRQARASEAQLTRSEREQLQIALRWAGVYDAGIDAAFGRGTRSAMAEWQGQNGYERTGVLTTMQRQDLLDQYNAVLEGMDMTLVTDDRAGIRIEMPLGAVAFDRYEAPFALYEPTGDLDARVLLISQPGDRAALNGLYEIMQTLEIVPLDGPRERRGNGFSLTGRNSSIVSHTEVTLRDGHIKGWTLIWPAGDEERRERVMNAMRASFSTTDAVLDPTQITDEGQAVDLVSGLEIRKPTATVSGFFVDGRGAVVTAANAVQSCGRVTLDDTYEASVAASDADLGAALLRPSEALAPRAVGAFRADTPRLKSEVAVAGYPFGGVLSAPTLTFGSLEDLQGLEGEAELERLALSARPGDAGGPVLDNGGAVLGMLLPQRQGNQALPDDVAFAADASALQAFLRDSGVSASETRGERAMDPEDLTSLAADMTVKVSCWE